MSLRSDNHVTSTWDAWAPHFDTVWEGADGSDEADFLVDLVPTGSFLEMGAGTGRVALELAARGRSVTCVDASVGMVDRLREKAADRGVDITPHVADMLTFDAGDRYDCIYFAMSTFFSLLSQAEQIRCLENASGLLNPGGKLVQECFVPTCELLAGGTRVAIRSIDGESPMLSLTVVDRAQQLIRYSEVTLGAHGTRNLKDVQRYCWPSEMDLMARLAGFGLLTRFGSYGRDPFHAGCYQQVAVYELRADAPGSISGQGG